MKSLGTDPDAYKSYRPFGINTTFPSLPDRVSWARHLGVHETLTTCFRTMKLFWFFVLFCLGSPVGDCWLCETVPYLVDNALHLFLLLNPKKAYRLKYSVDDSYEDLTKLVEAVNATNNWAVSEFNFVNNHKRKIWIIISMLNYL